MVTKSTTSTTAIATTITTTPVDTAAIEVTKASLISCPPSLPVGKLPRRDAPRTDGEPTARVADMAIGSGRYVFVREARMAGREALGGVLLRRPGHSPRCCAHLLRADVAVSDAAAGGVAPGPAGRVSGHLQRDHPPPASCRARGHPGAARRRRAGGAEKQGHRRGGPRHRDPDGPVRGYRLPRSRAARSERRVRGVTRSQLRAPQAD